MSIKRMDILGITGIPMRVLFIPAKEQSPLLPDLKPDDWDKVEFYDSRYDHTPEGQFISGYHVQTLRNGDRTQGLDLCGGEYEWQIDYRTKRLVLDWVEIHSGPKETV